MPHYNSLFTGILDKQIVILQRPHSPLKKLSLSCSLSKRMRILEPCFPSLTTLEMMGAVCACVYVCVCVCVCVCVYVMCAQSYLTLCDPMDCSPSGSFVHGTFPGKNSGVGCHFRLRGSSGLRDRTHVSVNFFTTAPPGKHQVAYQVIRFLSG